MNKQIKFGENCVLFPVYIPKTEIKKLKQYAKDWNNFRKKEIKKKEIKKLTVATILRYGGELVLKENRL